MLVNVVYEVKDDLTSFVWTRYLLKDMYNIITRVGKSDNARFDYLSNFWLATGKSWSARWGHHMYKTWRWEVHSAPPRRGECLRTALRRSSRSWPSVCWIQWSKYCLIPNMVTTTEPKSRLLTVKYSAKSLQSDSTWSRCRCFQSTRRWYTLSWHHEAYLFMGIQHYETKSWVKKQC
jgi:hypothetical protein